MDPTADIKSGFTVRNVITFIVAFIIVNAILDIIGNIVPVVPNFIMRPVTTVKGLISSKKAPAA